MIPLKDQEFIRSKFDQALIDPVKIEFFTQREMAIYVHGREPCVYCKPTQEVLQELVALSDKISLHTHFREEEPKETAKYSIDRIPAIVVRAEGRRAGRSRDGGRMLKFFGMPSGNEFAIFVETIVDISQGTSLLSEKSKRALRKVKEDIRIQVFVTPTCPYCPQMVRTAYHLALDNPHIQAEVVEINEFPDLAQRYEVQAVPLTIINDAVIIPGAVPENVFVEQVVKVARGTGVAEQAPAASTESSSKTPTQSRQEPSQRGQRLPSGLYIP